MYGKIFDSIYDGTLRANWKALVTFQQLIVLSDADGIVDMTQYALHGRTGIPLDIIEEGIKHLSEPDPNSRSKTEDGRRIVLIDPNRPWGWKLVNHQHYKELRTAEDRREYMQQYMRDYRKNNPPNQGPSKQESLPELTVKDGKPELAPLADTDTDTDTDIKKNSRKNVPFFDIVNLYHQKLPELPSVVKLTASRKSHIRQRWIEDLKDLDAWGKYFDIIRTSPFLMGKVKPTNGHRQFRATLDWLCNSENICNVMEGKYHG